MNMISWQVTFNAVPVAGYDGNISTIQSQIRSLLVANGWDLQLVSASPDNTNFKVTVLANAEEVWTGAQIENTLVSVLQGGNITVSGVSASKYVPVSNTLQQNTIAPSLGDFVASNPLIVFGGAALLLYLIMGRK